MPYIILWMEPHFTTSKLRLYIFSICLHLESKFLLYTAICFETYRSEFRNYFTWNSVYSSDRGLSCQSAQTSTGASVIVVLQHLLLLPYLDSGALSTALTTLIMRTAPTSSALVNRTTQEFMAVRSIGACNTRQRSMQLLFSRRRVQQQQQQQ